jgi:hypothetical protein
MMNERSWIVRSVMRVIARIEKSTAWERSGFVFVCVDVVSCHQHTCTEN